MKNKLLTMAACTLVAVIDSPLFAGNWDTPQSKGEVPISKFSLMNKQNISRLCCIGWLLFYTSVMVLAQSIKVPVRFPAQQWRAGSKEVYLLSKEFNPTGIDYGTVTDSVDINRLYISKFPFPTTQVSYFQPQTKSGGLTNIASFLKKKRSPKVVVRLPEKLTNANFVESIELALTELGWNVVDHNMAKEVQSAIEIRKRTGADLLLDISWLKFSAPDMYSSIDKSSVLISSIRDVSVMVSRSYYVYDSFKAYQKWIKSKDNKYCKIGHGVDWVSADFSICRDEIVSQLGNYERFNTSKNVISAMFKLIDCSNGSILGFYHIGEPVNCRIDGGSHIKISMNSFDHRDSNGKRIERSFSDISNFYREHKDDIENQLIQKFLCYVDLFLPNGEIPFAAQLNEMEDVKLSDETISKSFSSESTSKGSYTGHTRDYYNAYFNSKYYRGSGRGYSSGSSSSVTNTSSSSTTSFKDAEYIKYSDFFGYYQPLTKKFIDEIMKLTGQ